MGTLEKIGYILLGASGGVFISTLLYERELRRGIGEEESYIPNRMVEKVEDVLEDLPENVESTIRSKFDDITTELETKAEKRRFEFENLRKNPEAKTKSVKTDYHSKYQSTGKNMVDDILNNIPAEFGTDEHEDMTDAADEAAYLQYIEKEETDDIPPEDEPVDDTDLVVERVEEWIEVYLDENPQDFVSLVFYEGDETLCDDREQLISNPDEVIGNVALSRLVEGGPGAENGIIFVRNLKTMINYEVVLDAGKYSETVLGIFESNLDKGSGGDVDNR